MKDLAKNHMTVAGWMKEDDKRTISSCRRLSNCNSTIELPPAHTFSAQQSDMEFLLTKPSPARGRHSGRKERPCSFQFAILR